jgi:hypothetical protein
MTVGRSATTPGFDGRAAEARQLLACSANLPSPGADQEAVEDAIGPMAADGICGGSVDSGLDQVADCSSA